MTGWYLVADQSEGIVGFPLALSAEREWPVQWVALHLLCWYIAVARRAEAVTSEVAA